MFDRVFICELEASAALASVVHVHKFATGVLDPGDELLLSGERPVLGNAPRTRTALLTGAGSCLIAEELERERVEDVHSEVFNAVLPHVTSQATTLSLPHGPHVTYLPPCLRVYRLPDVDD